MKKRTIILIFTILLLAAASYFTWDVMAHWKYVDAFSGATPLALERQVPDNLQLLVDGKVQKNYTFNSRALRLLAKTRIRTREVSPEGQLLGAYIYNGIPLLHILEGVAPKKTKKDAFNRPLDMIVQVTAASGRKASFSYGELTMKDDRDPVIMAFHREPLMPSKDPEAYKKNKHMGNIQGLRLICPADKDTARYLDDVKGITLIIPPSPDQLLPKMKKGQKCTSSSILCVEGTRTFPALYDNVESATLTDWFRIGHGRGIKGKNLSQAKGYDFSSFLKQNFPHCQPDDFFLVVACDGYRCLFSGREIFATPVGQTMVLIQEIDGVSPPPAGKTLAIQGDFFVDRNIWGVSHVVRIAK